ncbi:uncharacterized protein BJ171DRAFT_484562 [Polychytrium aggregatum]|uniref:uncharacterized protein n=1 Tax=Polychytrium aggregatum TaxID=110093 RepID=UPI0022FED047|nr:uncharacterized protein BJ171DRAFT_484562 [Polychytrium aggregatum]KAI9209625.1 hypothetical protein BJ171DRAFT_484562 [Polychytrium aggregatum]
MIGDNDSAAYTASPSSAAGSKLRSSTGRPMTTGSAALAAAGHLLSPSTSITPSLSTPQPSTAGSQLYPPTSFDLPSPPPQPAYPASHHRSHNHNHAHSHHTHHSRHGHHHPSQAHAPSSSAPAGVPSNQFQKFKRSRSATHSLMTHPTTPIPNYVHIPKLTHSLIQHILEVNEQYINILFEAQNNGWLVDQDIKIYQKRLQANLLWLANAANEYRLRASSSASTDSAARGSQSKSQPTPGSPPLMAPTDDSQCRLSEGVHPQSVDERIGSILELMGAPVLGLDSKSDPSDSIDYVPVPPFVFPSQHDVRPIQQLQQHYNQFEYLARREASILGYMNIKSAAEAGGRSAGASRRRDVAERTADLLDDDEADDDKDDEHEPGYGAPVSTEDTEGEGEEDDDDDYVPDEEDDADEDESEEEGDDDEDGNGEGAGDAEAITIDDEDSPAPNGDVDGGADVDVGIEIDSDVVDSSGILGGMGSKMATAPSVQSTLQLGVPSPQILHAALGGSAHLKSDHRGNAEAHEARAPAPILDDDFFDFTDAIQMPDADDDPSTFLSSQGLGDRLDMAPYLNSEDTPQLFGAPLDGLLSLGGTDPMTEGVSELSMMTSETGLGNNDEAEDDDEDPASGAITGGYQFDGFFSTPMGGGTGGEELFSDLFGDMWDRSEGA